MTQPVGSLRLRSSQPTRPPPEIFWKRWVVTTKLGAWYSNLILRARSCLIACWEREQNLCGMLLPMLRTSTKITPEVCKSIRSFFTIFTLRYQLRNCLWGSCAKDRPCVPSGQAEFHYVNSVSASAVGRRYQWPVKCTWIGDWFTLVLNFITRWYEGDLIHSSVQFFCPRVRPKMVSSGVMCRLALVLKWVLVVNCLWKGDLIQKNNDNHDIDCKFSFFLYNISHILIRRLQSYLMKKPETTVSGLILIPRGLVCHGTSCTCFMKFCHSLI